MAYKHYWSRALEFQRDAFALAVYDIRQIVMRAEDMGLRLAGPSGRGKPQLGPETIAFNGMASCGHKYRDLGEPWASPTASGVEEKEPPYDPNAEPFMGGPLLETRVCGGSCAGEAFCVDRKYMVRDWERPGQWNFYDCACHTHFKPYDLIVTAALIRLKEHLGDMIKIASENPAHGFEDAKRLCREMFGWNSKFEVEEPKAEVLL